MKQKYHLLLNLFIMAVIGITSNNAFCEESIFIGAGAGLKTALDPVAKSFTEKTGIKVNCSYLCSAMVLTNLQLTRHGDLFLSGSEHFMEIAINKKIVDPTTIQSVGYMIPCIAVSKGNPLGIHSLEDLIRPIKVGVGEPDALAVGKLTVQMLENIGIYEKVQKNIVYTAGGARKLALTTAFGNIDAAINWIPVMKQFHDKSEIIMIADQNLMYTVAPIAVTTFSKKRLKALEFINFCTSGDGTEIFQKFGYNAYFNPDKVTKVNNIMDY
jgi:molybdate transport system substrate-binding protein